MQVQAELESTDAAGRDRRGTAVAPDRGTRPDRRRLFFLISLTAYLTDAVVHPAFVLNWYDLNVYNDAGLITRQLPFYLYIWQLSVERQVHLHAVRRDHLRGRVATSAGRRCAG